MGRTVARRRAARAVEVNVRGRTNPWTIIGWIVLGVIVALVLGFAALVALAVAST